MIILFAMLGYVILGAVIVVLLFSRTRLKENIHSLAVRYDRALAHLAAVKKAAQRGEDRCRELVDTTQQALGVAQQVEVVGERVEVMGQRVDSLITYVRQPEIEAPGRHAYHHALPGNPPSGATPVSIANGVVHYISDGQGG